MPQGKQNTVADVWALIDVRGPDECWPCRGTPNDQGYCRVTFHGKRWRVHALVFTWEKGPVPVGHQVDHDCHNGSGCAGGPTCLHRQCCNPRHLVARTARENTLLGAGPSARHARATHCPQGHPYNKANTYRRSDNSRRCRECERVRQIALRAAASLSLAPATAPYADEPPRSGGAE